MSVYDDYLTVKKEEGARMKIFLKSVQTGASGNLTGKMLSGQIEDFDDEVIQLRNEECIIFRDEITSIKPDNGRDRR